MEITKLNTNYIKNKRWRWYYLSAQWLSGELLLSNITVFDICCFRAVILPLTTLQTVVNCENVFDNNYSK